MEGSSWLKVYDGPTFDNETLGMKVEWSIADLANEFARASKVYSDSDRYISARLCEAGKAFLNERVHNVIREAGEAPILSSYSSDGTPIKTVQRMVAADDKHRVVRKGGSGMEYLVERFFVSAKKKFGQPVAAVSFRDPVPMTAGKSAWAIFACGRQFMPTVREMGHRGIAVNHYCWDRAAFSILEKRFQQLHFLLESLPSSSQSQVLDNLLNWFLASGCVCHDGHNSLKWSMLDQMKDAQGLRDLFVAIESVRNSYDMLHDHLPSWIKRRAMFVDARDEEVEQALTLWVALGVESEYADVLANLALRFRNGHLEVARAWEGDDSVWDRVAVAILHVMRFRKFADSRWVTVGRSCRSVVASLLLGLDDLIDMVRSNPCTSQYYIGGYTRLSPSLRRFCGIASFAAYVSDAFLCELLEDDRVIRWLRNNDSRIGPRRS